MKNKLSYLYLLPVVSYLFLLICKIAIIGYQDQYALGLTKDFFGFFVVFFLSIKRESRFYQYIQNIVVSLIILFVFMDLCVFLGIKDRITFNNIISNIQYYDVFIYFISKKIMLLTGAMLILILLLRNKTVKIPILSSSINILSIQLSVVLLVASFWLGSKNTIANQGDALNLSNNSITATSITSETLKKIAENRPLIEKIKNYFDGKLWLEQSNSNQDKPNLVIVISESLSGVDSKYGGGLFNRLPMIDKMQQDGIVFTQAVSNGKITAHGLAASLLGIQTNQTGGYASMMEQFPPKQFFENNVVDYAKKNGYETIIISPGQPESFYGMSNWFQALGFDKIYDIDSPIFKKAPRFTWNAPSDEAMFQAAEKMLPTLKTPYLLVIETVSLHQPYILPDPKYKLGDDELLNQINYVDHTTYDFYQAIKKMGFLENGILALFGDHRRFQPLEQEEINDGGYSVWHERIVFGMVGKGISPHTIYNVPYSLVDVNILLHYIIQGKPVNASTLALANLSTMIGAKEPFSISLVDDDRGTYLIRSEKNQPLYISIHGDIPFDQIPNESYVSAVTYLIKNELYIRDKLNLKNK